MSRLVWIRLDRCHRECLVFLRRVRCPLPLQAFRGVLRLEEQALVATVLVLTDPARRSLLVSCEALWVEKLLLLSMIVVLGLLRLVRCPPLGGLSGMFVALPYLHRLRKCHLSCPRLQWWKVGEMPCVLSRGVPARLEMVEGFLMVPATCTGVALLLRAWQMVVGVLVAGGVLV